MGDTDMATRCGTLLSMLDRAFGWQLDGQTIHRYRSALASLLPPDCSDMLLRRVIINYHSDHALLHALRDQTQPQHVEAWRSWMDQARRILQRNGLAWSSDGAVDSDDLVQVAHAELVRALPSFRYTSRFSTWAYQVIVQSVQRELRNSQAQKRAVRPDPLEAAAPVLLFDERERPEQHATAALLIDQSLAVLAHGGDARLKRIFLLCVVADMRPEDVAPVLRLHPSRIRALLGEARQLLQNDPTLRLWNVDAPLRELHVS